MLFRIANRGSVYQNPRVMTTQPTTSIEKALDLLLALGQHGGRAGLLVLAEHVGAPKSSAHRLLQSLVSRGLVSRTADGDYQLGSALVVLDIDDEGDMKRVLFSGDLGRHAMPIRRDPEHPDGANVLILEGTYGDRLHPPRAQMEDDLAAKMAAGGAAAAPVAGAAEAGGAAPFAGKETAAEEKAEKAVQQAMERRVVGAEKAAAEAAAEVEKLKAERQAERVQQFTRWAISGPVEEGGGRWPAEDEKGLQEMIKDFGGDLDKARKHVLRLPVPQAMGRLTRGGNPAGATAVEPNTLAYQTMTRDSKAQTFSRLTREAMQKNPKLTLAEAQVLIEREHPGLYTA